MQRHTSVRQIVVSLSVLLFSLFLFIGVQQVIAVFSAENAPLINSVTTTVNNDATNLTVSASGVAAASQQECSCDPPPQGEPPCPNYIWSIPYAHESPGSIFIYEDGGVIPVLTVNISYSESNAGSVGLCEWGDSGDKGSRSNFSGTNNAINISSLDAGDYDVEVRACHANGSDCDIASDTFTIDAADRQSTLTTGVRDANVSSGNVDDGADNVIVNCTANTCTGDYDNGESVTLTATPNAGFAFDEWIEGSGCGTRNGNQATFTMNGPRSCTARFVVAQFTLTLNKAGAGQGTVTSAPNGISCGTSCNSDSADFDADDSVTLTASPDSNSSFTGWSGGGCSGTGTCQVTMDADKTVTATFANVPSYTLTVDKSGDGQGTVTSSPGGISCDETCSDDSASYQEDTVVTLSASEAAGSTFTGWSLINCSGTGDCQVTMDQARTVTADFDFTAPPTVDLTVKEEGAGGAGGDSVQVDIGDRITLEWTVSNADTCEAISDPFLNANRWGPDTNPNANGGTKSFDPALSVSTTLRTLSIECGNENGSTTDSVVVSLPLPIVDLTIRPQGTPGPGGDNADVEPGQSVTLEWTVTNGDSCVASTSPVFGNENRWGANTNPDPNGASKNFDPQLSESITQRTHSITCSNTNGSATDSVTATSLGLPTITLGGRDPNEVPLDPFDTVGPVYVADQPSEVRTTELEWTIGGPPAASCTGATDDSGTGFHGANLLTLSSPRSYLNFKNRLFSGTCENNFGATTTHELDVRLTGDVEIVILDEDNNPVSGNDIAQWTLTGPDPAFDRVESSYVGGTTYNDMMFGSYTLNEANISINPASGYEFVSVIDFVQNLNHSVNQSAAGLVFEIKVQELEPAATIDGNPLECIIASGDSTCDSDISWTASNIAFYQVHREGSFFYCGDSATPSDTQTVSLGTAVETFEIFAATSCDILDIITPELDWVAVRGVHENDPRLRINVGRLEFFVGETIVMTTDYDEGDGLYDEDVTDAADWTDTSLDTGSVMLTAQKGTYTAETEGQVRIDASYFNGFETVDAPSVVVVIDDPTNNEECSDLVDNDEDGDIDYDGLRGSVAPDSNCTGPDDDKELGEPEVIEI